MHDFIDGRTSDRKLSTILTKFPKKLHENKLMDEVKGGYMSLAPLLDPLMLTDLVSHSMPFEMPLTSSFPAVKG